MPCPEPGQLAAMIGGGLAAAERETLTTHLDDCEDCRSAVALLAKLSPSEAARGTVAEVATSDTLPAADPLARTATSGEILPPELAPPAPASSREPGRQTFDRYILGGILGRGGMGIVYAARDPKLGRDIAIKVLRPDLAREHPGLARQVVQEARVMAKISHPNVLAVFDVGVVGDQVYLAMELVTGTSLRAWLAAGPRTVAEIVEVFVLAGRGLVAAHDAGIVHRDFKPDNVLVGDDGRIRVTDFGLAIARGSEDDLGGGTPAYMAPEQFAGGTVDGRTDQFAFCVALYEALYQRRPFAGKSYDELDRAVGRGEVLVAPPGSRVPPSLHAIVVRGLAVTPGDRFPTLADLLKALARDRGRRPRQIALLAAAALATVVVGLGADWVVRDRIRVVTRASFSSTRAYVRKELDQRTETFESQSETVYETQLLQRIAATPEQADFGLDDAAHDRKILLQTHDALASATWVKLVHKGSHDAFAIADRKGRLLYTSAAPEQWDLSITVVPAIAAAYGSGDETTRAVIRASDPQVVASGILHGVRDGLFVMFVRVKVESDLAKAAFVRLVPASDLIRDFAVEDDPIELSIVADGTEEGSVPPGVIAAARDDPMATGTQWVVDNRDTWLVQRVALVSDGAGGELVLARHIDVGLDLFPRARLVLALLAIGLVGVAVGGWIVARRRDLTRR
jgi:serine/threonine protein kinase